MNGRRHDGTGQGRSDPARSEAGRNEPGRSEPGRNEPGRSAAGGAPPAGLADERTHLSWRRTTLALGGGSLVAARLLAAHVGAVGWLVGAAGVAVSLLLALLAGRGTARRRVGMLVVGTSAGAVLLAVVGLLVVLAGGPRV